MNRSALSEQRMAAARARRARRQRRDFIAVIGIIVMWIALLLVGGWIDISWFLVGGITKAYNATNGHEMAWGIVRALAAGIGVFIAICIGWIGTVAWVGWAEK